MKNYMKNYQDSITLGLSKTTYKIKGVPADGEEFFEELNTTTLELQSKGGRLFFFGNGASAAFSHHMALDWSKNGGVLSLSLGDSAMLTALANDYDFEGCFREFLKMNSPTSSDLVVTTSSSGNSKNVVSVLEYCKDNNISTFGLSGLNEGNRTEQLADYSLFVPMKTYGMVECIHQIFHHLYFDKFVKVEEWTKTESQNMSASNYRL